MLRGKHFPIAMTAGAALMLSLTGCGPAHLGAQAGSSRPAITSAPRPSATTTSPAPTRSPAGPTGSVPSTSTAAPVQAPVAGAGIGGPNWSSLAKAPTRGRYLYVSGTGDDKANGLSAATALRTPAKAATMTEPGDTVLVGNGEYSAPGRSSVLPIERSGTPDKWITWAAAPGARPVVRATGWQGIHVHAAYIVVAGFTVIGMSRKLTKDQLAAAKRNDISDPEISSNCIAADEQKTANPPHRPHHVVIWGNTVTDCPLGGISAMLADYVTVAYNIAARNGFYSPFGGSGISFLGAWNSDNSTATKMVIRGNVTYDNWNLIPCRCSGFTKVTDGNGIIVDSFSNESFRGAPMFQQPYWGRTLVEDNISYANGGRGVNVFQSAHVDVVNNTVYRNALHAAIETNLSVSGAQDVRVVNNVVVSATSKPAATVSNSSDVRFDHNLIVGASNAPADPAGLTTDPGFTDPAHGDFRLRAGSPAINSGTATLAPAVDADRSTRVGGVDRGALESR